jgi:hypothetical protein
MRTTIFLIALVLSISGPAAAQLPPAAMTTGPRLGPLTLTSAILACTDLPTTATGAAPALQVAAVHNADPRFHAGPGDLVVVGGGAPQGLAIGQQYFARRVKPPVDHEPVTAANPAAIVTAGWLTIVSVDQQFALARVDHACVAIEAGDYLEPYAEPALPGGVADGGDTDFSQLGRVLFGVFRRSTFGAGDVLSIDHGSSKGMAVATRLAFYRDRRNNTPLVEIGEGIVVAVAADTAKVVLERAAQEIRTGDYYAVRGKP